MDFRSTSDARSRAASGIGRRVSSDDSKSASNARAAARKSRRSGETASGSGGTNASGRHGHARNPRDPCRYPSRSSHEDSARADPDRSRRPFAGPRRRPQRAIRRSSDAHRRSPLRPVRKRLPRGAESRSCGGTRRECRHRLRRRRNLNCSHPRPSPAHWSCRRRLRPPRAVDAPACCRAPVRSRDRAASHTWSECLRFLRDP